MRMGTCIALLGLIGLPGCIHKSTEELSLGGVVEVEAITAATPASVDPAANAATARDEWPARTVLAPNDQTTRLPRFRSNPRLASDSPRRAGQWPHALSSVDLDLTESGPRAELITAPVIAGLDVLLIPFRTKSPQAIPYERRRATVDLQPVVMPIEDEHE